LPDLVAWLVQADRPSESDADRYSEAWVLLQ